MEAALSCRAFAAARALCACILAVPSPATAQLTPDQPAPARASAASADARPAARPQPGPQQKLLLEKLEQHLDAVSARLDGVLGVYVEDLTTGAAIARRADQLFPTASSIKLAVLYELYRQAEQGRVDLLALVTPPPHPVPSAGILRFMRAPSQLTLRDLGLLVMALSDNEAANELIRRVGMDSVNRRLDALSLPRTRLRRLMLDLAAARRGDENVSTPRELARLAALVARGDGLSAPRAADLLAVASVPDEASPFRRGLPPEQRAISKPGSLDGVRCEAAWVDVPGRPYAAAIMTSYLNHDADGEAAISELSAAIYATFDRLARSSDLGRALQDRATPR